MVFHQFSFSPSFEWKAFFNFLAKTELFEPIDLAWGQFVQNKFPTANVVQVFTAIFLSHLVGKNHLQLRLGFWAEKDYPEVSTKKIVTFPTLTEWLKQLETADPQLIARVKSQSKDPQLSLMILDEEAVYLQKYFSYQQNLVNWLVNRKNLDAINKKNEQKNFLIISGGPGTGKTTQVFEHILSELKLNSQSRIALLAPTGKAAKRLSQAITNSKFKKQQESNDKAVLDLIKLVSEDTATVHRFLSEQQYLRKKRYQNTVDVEMNWYLFDLIVLDEASMIAVPLFHELLPILTQTKKVILLGDKDQLSSVEEGSLFFDLVTPVVEKQAEFFPLKENIIFLTKNYRYADISGIARVANAIATSLPTIDSATEVFKLIEEYRVTEYKEGQVLQHQKSNQAFLKQDFFYYQEINLKTIKNIWKQYLLPHYEKWFNLVQEFKSIPAEDLGKNTISKNHQNILKQLFILQEQQAILTAKRKGAFGVNAINQLTHDWLIEAGCLLQQVVDELQAGVMIIINRNRYDLGLYNGDIGIVLDGSSNQSTGIKQKKIFFQQRESEYFAIVPEQINHGEDYEYAFAITIHKSQGSEYNEVMVIMEDHKKSYDFITREMCYTAITRAKAKVYFLMESEQLQHALAQAGIRHSGIKSQLMQSCQ